MKQRALVAAVCLLFAAGCATDPKTGNFSITETFASKNPCSNNARNIGLVAGGVAGAIIANQVKNTDSSRLFGAAAGAAIGGLIGADMDRRRCEIFRIAQKNKLDVQFDDIKSSQLASLDLENRSQTASDPALGMKVAIKDNGNQFKSGSDELSAEALGYFQQIADQYSYSTQKKLIELNASKSEIEEIEALKTKKIFLVGHTDDVGNSLFNANLSEKRAKAVAKVFKSRGIQEDQLFFQGAGEVLPVADNRTEEGRAKNRRVEIVDVGSEDQLKAFLFIRKPNLRYYRASQDTELGTPTAVPPAHNTQSELQLEPTKQISPVKSVKNQSQKPKILLTPQSETGITRQSIPNSQTKPAKPYAIDFGGKPINLKDYPLNIGKIEQQKSALANITSVFISSAQADVNDVLGPCNTDRVRQSNPVKSFKDGKEYGTHEFMPGMNNAVWVQKNLNTHYVALTNVAILRDGAVVAKKPELRVYPNYKEGDKPAFQEDASVNVYEGSNSILYRVFPENVSKAPMLCMDVMFPRKMTAQTLPKGIILYTQKAGTPFQVSFDMTKPQ
jgi:outer membrane protein OmpA-like peptidoglycan-associated protein